MGGGIAGGLGAKPVYDELKRPITAGGFVDTGAVVFEDITERAGLSGWTHKMGVPEKNFIVETNGSGVGLIDYDNDGWLDIYLVNGSTFDALDGKETPPHSALFHNNHDGTFTDVAAKAGAVSYTHLDVYKRQPETWSVVDCVEHMVASEAELLSRLKQATPRNESHKDQAREEKLQGLALNRLRRIEAPEPVLPTGKYDSLHKAMEGFNSVRGETAQFVQEFQGDLRSWLTIHPMITRPLNCYEMLLLMALHPMRHAVQISEIRAGLSVRIDARVTAP